MGYEQEAFRKLMSNIWGKQSRMQEEMSKGAKGEPFIVQELSRKGPADADAAGCGDACHYRQGLHVAVRVGKEGADYARNRPE